MVSWVTVQPEEIQKLRKELACTAREFATALGVDPKDVTAWEAGELFPTKRHVTAMAALRERGPTAIVRAPRGKAAAKTGQQRLADPSLWRLVRKLIEHPALFDEASKLAEKYSDPAEPEAQPKRES
jgi:transcriptional regulator with XRE-family HTH domain